MITPLVHIPAAGRDSFLLLLATVFTALAQPAPYQLDANTRNLWHFDETAGAASSADAVAGGNTLAAIRDSATLGNTSFAGFGLAASTFDAGPGATLAANPNGVPGRDAYLAPLPLVNGTGDNSTLNFTGTNGAFTMEALLRVDFDPARLAVAPDISRAMQIVSADAEETVRLFQFKLAWTGTNDPAPKIMFINIGAPIQTISAAVPMTGSNAMASNAWYHVAATYNGQPNTADNFKFYWTKAETNRTRADLLTSLTMTNNLPVGSADWTIGNEGRATGGSDQNWVGLIDEVRLSSVARQPGDFIFRDDSEPDGLPDAWEWQYFGNLSQTATNDPDGDDFNNLAEFQAGSNPTNALSTPLDTDADGLPDTWEMQYFGSLVPTGGDDTDGDGYANATELAAGTSPVNPTSNPLDTDADGLPDAWELATFGSLAQLGTDDFDGDWFNNREEFLAGTDAKAAASHPPGLRVRLVPVDDANVLTSEYARSGGINTASFLRSSILTVSNQQFVTYYGRHQTDPSDAFNDKLWVARRTVGAAVWEMFRTSFTANNITDGHDCISFGIDGLGYMHLSWGMHADTFHYAKSLAPVTGTNLIAFGPDGPMTGKEGNTVTYPQFLTLTNGDLLYFFRKGGSGNGDLFLNRYRIASQTWTNVNVSGATQLAFIKGTGFTPNYNAYWQKPCIDQNGNVHVVWMWRYNSDSPAGEVGYQTNHDFDYAWSPDGGTTWKRPNSTNYVLPINERGENGNTNSIGERVIAIPEGYSLMNQGGMCVDRSNQPVLANWWAPGAATNNHQRQYMVGFPGTPGTNRWEVRQISFRTMDSPTNKIAETALGTSRMGRPMVVCDKDDRLIVIYSDNEAPSGLKVVHSLPKALDPQRLLWTQFSLTTNALGAMDAPNLDVNRWEMDNQLHIFYLSPSTGNTAAAISVLEWDAAAYFAHQPAQQLTFANGGADAVISFPTQVGWGYRLWSSTNLTGNAWQQINTISGNGAVQQIIHTNGGVGPQHYWRLQIQEGGFL